MISDRPSAASLFLSKSSGSFSCQPSRCRGSVSVRTMLKTVLTYLGFLHVDLRSFGDHPETASCVATSNLVAMLILSSAGTPGALCLTFADN